MNFLSTGFDFQFGETIKIYLDKGMIEMYWQTKYLAIVGSVFLQVPVAVHALTSVRSRWFPLNIWSVWPSQ